MKSQGKKVFVGMSGGVDSSVSAALLLEQGYDVTGVFIKVWTPPFLECTWKDDRLDAMRVAAKLGIPFITLDLEKEYKSEVVDYMIREYKLGRTPNPDVMCNKEIKFGAFYKFAREQGADYVATGHYARILSDKIREISNDKHQKTNNIQKPIFKLQTGKDENKDQSYFLWNLKKEQLPHILFPVGGMLKPEVRRLAEKFGLITADKKDSQGLCFLGKVDMKEFLAEFIKPKKGKVLDEEGKVIGTHNGAVFHTLGERHGFTVEKHTTHDAPLYVVGKNIKNNTITVGPRVPVSKKRDSAKFSSIKANWISAVPSNDVAAILGRFRYRQKLFNVKILSVSQSKAEVSFSAPDSLPAPGQSLVLYEGDVCIGGGVIQ